MSTRQRAAVPDPLSRALAEALRPVIREEVERAFGLARAAEQGAGQPAAMPLAEFCRRLGIPDRTARKEAAATGRFLGLPVHRYGSGRNRRYHVARAAAEALIAGRSVA